MTRLLVLPATAVALLLCAGCGSVLAPSLIGIPGLATNEVPSDAASVVVVTARTPGRGLEGRVVDRDSGAPIAGIRLDSGATTDADGAFRLAPGTTTLRADAACYAPLDASIDADEASLLVLMAPVDC